MLSSNQSYESLSQVNCLEPHVLYVPSGVRATGDKITTLERNFASQTQRILHSPTQIISRMESADGYCEESVMKITHDEVIDWLLPGVKPTNKFIILPMMTIAKYANDGKLLFKRHYWDQASVLKQLGIIPTTMRCKANASEVVLPVLDGRIADLLVSLPEAEFEPVQGVKPSYTAGLSSHQANTLDSPRASGQRPPSSSMASLLSDESGMYASRPSTRVQQHPGGKSSNIFGNEPLELANTGKKYFSGSNSSQISHEQNEFEVANTGKKYYSGSNASQISMDATGVSHETQQDAYVYHGRKLFPGAGVSTESTQDMNTHLGRRQFAGSNDSHFSLSDNSAAEVKSHVKRRDPNARSEENYVRPSSRVLSAPGGRSTIHFG